MDLKPEVETEEEKRQRAITDLVSLAEWVQEEKDRLNLKGPLETIVEEVFVGDTISQMDTKNIRDQEFLLSVYDPQDPEKREELDTAFQGLRLLDIVKPA